MRDFLTHREWLTWCLLRGGASAKDIAYSLGVSRSTAEFYTTRVRQKRGTIGQPRWAS